MQLDSLRAALDRTSADIGGAKAAIVDVAMHGGGHRAAEEYALVMRALTS